VFQSPVHPAAVTIGDGIELAMHALTVSWKKWGPAVAALALVQAVPSVLVGNIGSWYGTDRYTGRVIWNPALQDKAGLLALSFLLVAAVTVASGWVFAGVAISGLRNRPLTAGWVVSRGLLTVAAGILVFICLFVAIVACALIFIVLAAMTGLLAILALLAGVVGLIYVAVRLVFFTLAIFDGYGALDGLTESWALSERSVMRIFGWGLMGFAISLGFSILGGIVTATMSSMHQPVAGAVVSAGITGVASVVLVFLMTVLYESQRSRRYFGGQPYWSVPQPGVPYPPYPPYPPYAGGPYAPPGGSSYPYAGAPDPDTWRAGPYTGAPSGSYPGAPYPGWPPAPWQAPAQTPAPEAPEGGPETPA
jgi:hypothetical protein